MTTRIHRPLKAIVSNANVILRQQCLLSKQLHDQHIDVGLVSETYLKPRIRFFVSHYHLYRTNRDPDLKDGTAVTVIKGSPFNHVLLPALNSVEAREVCV
jgi:hypothetical protein